MMYSVLQMGMKASLYQQVGGALERCEGGAVIVYGTTLKRRSRGIVAEYCPICRLPRAMEAIEVRSAWHVYYISPVSGKPAGIEVHCPNCLYENIVPMSYYAEFAENVEYSIDLLQATTPMLVDWFKGRAEIEERVYNGRPKDGERLMLIWEVITMLEYMAHKTMDTRQDMYFKHLLLFCLPIIPVALFYNFSDLTFGLLIFGVMIVVSAIYGVVFWKKRSRGHIVMRLLAQGLMPLDPTREELEQIGAGSGQSPLFKSLKPDKIVQAIEDSLNEYKRSEADSV